MSVQITGYRGLERITDEQADNETRLVHVYRIAEFIDRCDDVEDGFYRYAEASDGADLSYGGYNRMRDTLAHFAGYPAHPHPVDPMHTFSETAWEATEGPFWELINFSDSEGALGTATCKKLAADFAQFQEKFDDGMGRFWAPDSPFARFYADMRAMFELASDGGVVVFS